MARKSNVEKALEEILAELEPQTFKSKEDANAAIGDAIKAKVEAYNLDEEKQKELVDSIKANKDAVKIDEQEPKLSREDKLEKALAKLACMTGNRSICIEFGIEPWDPTKKDMSKYK